MKAKWLLLTKIQLTEFFGINKLRHSDDARVKRRVAGAAVVFVLAAAVILFYVVLTAIAFARMGMNDCLPSLAVAFAAITVFIFGLLKGGNTLFATKDYDAVMSLPVKKRDVIVSRLVCTYIAELLFCAIFIIPVSVVYFIYLPQGLNAADLFTIFAAFLFTPLLPMILSVAIGTVLAALTAKFRYKSLAQAILAILLFIGLMAASFALSYSSASDAANPAADMNSVFDLIVRNIYPPALFVLYTMQGKVWGIFAFIGISVAAAAVFVFVISAFYAKINARLTAGVSKGKFKIGSVRTASSFSALLKKECKRLFTSPAYLMNGAAGSAMLLVFTILMLISDPIGTIVGAAAQEGVALPSVGYAAAAMCMLFAGMTLASAASLSMEGKSRWIMFSLPVSARKIFMAKAVVNFILAVPTAIFFSAVACVQAEADVFTWILSLAAPIAFAAFISVAGVFLNYKFPKYEWTNERAALKNSIPALILSFGDLIIGIGIFILCLFLNDLAFIPVLAMTILSIAGCIALFVYFGKVRLVEGETAPAAQRADMPPGRKL